jgi:hypothetical protein
MDQNDGAEWLGVEDKETMHGLWHFDGDQLYDLYGDYYIDNRLLDRQYRCPKKNNIYNNDDYKSSGVALPNSLLDIYKSAEYNLIIGIHPFFES